MDGFKYQAFLFNKVIQQVRDGDDIWKSKNHQKIIFKLSTEDKCGYLNW